MNYSIKSLNLDEEESASELLKFYHFLDSCARCEPGKTPAWAAQGIDEYTREDLNNMGDYLFCFWGFFIDMVLQIDHEHPAFDLLVEVIAELQKRPPIKIEAFKVSDAYFINIGAFASAVTLTIRSERKCYGQISPLSRWNCSKGSLVCYTCSTLGS